ncbi:tyrosine-type recombinase/integrase [Salinicola avicenniae]|uniref:tyrosine-type recombinase/integrase n=1 Tax=Salinicola avicenniae TaxID=2916836 RepID=UPI0020737828|nr:MULTISPECIES: tyrosine-type recombinase/integrase [unclassified Salinicola]
MKRDQIKRRPLADTVLAKLEPEAREYRENYGVDRLYFVVTPFGRKRWELRYKKPHTGKWAWMGLGGYPDTSAKQARGKAKQITELLADGIDPIEHKSGAHEHPFREVAETWYRDKLDRGRAEKTLKGMRYWLDNDALPAFGDKAIQRVTRRDCAKVQEAIETRGAFNTAEKSRTWLNQIFGRAIAQGHTENNPASNLADIAAQPPKEERYPHLLEPELPEFLQALRASPSKTIVRTAAWMVVRTASRPGMVRWAEWSELDGKVWRVPAEKMKMRRDHVVPLTRQVLELLEKLRPFTGRSRYLFPGEGEKSPVISDMAINTCFSRLGYKGRMTGHGSRHTAKTLLAEHGWPADWTEAMLAHTKKGLEGIYNQAEYLRYRKRMMQWYCDYLDALEAGMTDQDRERFRRRVESEKS